MRTPFHSFLRPILKGFQLHAHIIKAGIQTIPLIFHHLINLCSKSQLPLSTSQVFEEAPHKSSTTWYLLFPKMSFLYLFFNCFVEFDVFVGSSIVDMYAKCGEEDLLGKCLMKCLKGL